MDYYQTINAHVVGECIAIKTIKADEASSLPKLVSNKSRQAAPSPGPVKGVNPEEIVAVINIRKCRLVKLTGKVWDQLSTGDDIWMLTSKEWKDHSEKVLVHECKVRHGKVLMIRNPSALNPRQVFEMVDAYFPHIEKQYTEMASPTAVSPAKPKAAPDTQTTKKPFLKAHTGSPYKPPPPYSEKRRQQLLQQQNNEHVNTGTPSADAPGEHKPFTLIGKKRSPSPGKSGGERNLATSNREQTVFPPLSPTLLRRVGLGGRHQQQHKQMHPPLRHYDQFDADGSVLTNDDYYGESDASPGALQSAFDGEASPEQKAVDRNEGAAEPRRDAADADAADGGPDFGEGAAAVADAIDEEGSMVSTASAASTPPPAPALAPAPAPAHVEFDMSAHVRSLSQPVDPTNARNGDSAEHSAEEYEGTQSDEDEDYQYIRDSGGVHSDLVDEVMLGAPDDGTLTTVTNSVMDCFSLQDPSISPRSSVHPGYDSHRESASQTVIEAEADLASEEGSAGSDDDDANLHDQSAYDLGVAETGTSIGSSDGEAAPEERSPSYDDVMAQRFGSDSDAHEGEVAGEGHVDDADSDPASSVSTGPRVPAVPANSYAEGEMGVDHRLSPALSVSTVHGGDATELHGDAVPNSDPTTSVQEEAESDASGDDHASEQSPASVELEVDDLAPLSPPVRVESTQPSPEDSHTGGHETSIDVAVPLPSETVVPTSLWHLEPSSASLPDVYGPLGPAEAILGLSDTDAEDRPPLRWQMTEEEPGSIGLESSDVAGTLTAAAMMQESGTEHAQDQRQPVASDGIAPVDAPIHPTSLWHLEPSSTLPPEAQSDLYRSLGPVDAVPGLSGTDVDDRPPLRWQVTEEEPGSLDQNSGTLPANVQVQEVEAERTQDALNPPPSDGAGPAIILPAGLLPAQEDASHSGLPDLSGSFNLGSPLGPALSPVDVGQLDSDLEEGVPPLRWQVTEEEPGSGLFDGIGHVADVEHHTEGIEVDLLPSPSPSDGFASVTVLAAGDLPPVDAPHNDLPALTGSFNLGPSLGPALGPAELSEDGSPPLRWQVTEDEDFAGAADAPQTQTEAPVSAEIPIEESVESSTDLAAEKGPASSVPAITAALPLPRRSFHMEELSESSSSSDDSSVASAGGSDAQAHQGVADGVSAPVESDSPDKEPQAETPAEDPIVVEASLPAPAAVLKNPMLSTPSKHQADDDHETNRMAHYSRLGSACVTGSAGRSSGRPGRGSPRSPMNVGLAGQSAFTDSAADDATVAMHESASPEVPAEPAESGEGLVVAHSEDSASSSAVPRHEDEEPHDLMYSEDRAAFADNERELFPLYTSASIEYTHGQHETHEALVTGREPTVPLAKEHEGDDGDVPDEPPVSAMEDTDVAEVEGAVPTDEVESDVSGPVRMQVDTSSDLREGCASPPSPILATTSELITLSPHRELESTTRFIRRVTADSSVEGSDAEPERQDADSDPVDPVHDEATTDGEGGDASPGTTTSAPDADNDVIEAVGDVEAAETAQQEPLTTVDFAVAGQLVVNSPPAATDSDPTAANTDATRELEDRVRRQAEELAEAGRVKAALEARLDETRKLLQIFAAGRLPAPVGYENPAATGLSAAPAGGAAVYSGTDVDIDALENTLKYVSVEPLDEATEDPFPQATAPMQSPDEGHSSSGNTTHMRKSLHRLLERKREEKLRLTVSESSPDAPSKTAAAPSARSAGGGVTARSPVKAVRTRPRPASGSIGGESSDSAFSGSESRGPGRIGGRAFYDAAGLPIVGFTIRKEPLKGKARHPDGTATAATSQQPAIAGIAESVDELDMAVTAVGSGSYRLDSGYSSNRATPTVAVVSLELDDLLQSNSSDPFTPTQQRSPHHGVDLTPAKVQGDEDTQSTPFAEPSGAVLTHVLRPLPDLPVQGPAQVPIAAPIPLLATGSTQASPRNSASLSAIAATGSAQLSPRNSTSTMSVSLSGAPELPLNLHIKSPRHLAVTLSSSSSASEDEKEDITVEGAGKPSYQASVNSGAASPPSTSTFSPVSSQCGKAGHFSPRQIAVKSPDQRHRSPVLEAIRVNSAASISTGGDAETGHAQLPVLDIVSSDGESSVESNNPLLLESTPKIRGFARRPLYSTQHVQHPPGALVAALEEAARAEGNSLPAAAAEAGEGVEKGPLQFFQDSFMIAPSDTGAAPSDDPLKQAPETTYLYDYNKYHKLRPELFMDSGPNSPFNPHSLFMHGGAHAAIREDDDHEDDGVTSSRDRSGTGEESWPAHQRILSETEINTVANASVARLEPSSATKGSSAAAAGGAARVSFSPNSEDVNANEGGTTEASTSESTAAVNDAYATLYAARVDAPSPSPAPESDDAEEEHAVKEEQTYPDASPIKSSNVASAKMEPVERAALHVDVELSSESVPATPLAAAAHINRGDKLAALLAYSQPFLATQRYLENPTARGQSGRQEVLRGIGLRDTISWCIFQLYGTPDGAMIKGIKMIQVVRALKDAEVCTSITTSQLDLLLTKIHVAAAKGTPVQGNTPTAAVIGPAAGGSRVLRRTASGLNAAAAPVGSSAALQSVGTNSSKSEQNSNSLAGAAFPTFCALLSAIAGIVYSADPKIRVRVIKKGVTLGDLSHYYTTPLEEREVANARLETQWRALLERRDHQDVLRMLQESQISTSGLLLRSVYRRCSPLAPVSGSPSPAAMEGGCWSPQLVRTLAEADLDLIRLVWERNSDQIRQIYGFYAMSKDARRQGSGPSKLLLGFEHCREALVDFQILPHVVDAQGFARLYKVVKLWELQVAEQLLAQAQDPSSAGSGALGAATPMGADGASVAYFAPEGGANESLNTSFGTHSSFRAMSVGSPTTGAGGAGGGSVVDGNQSIPPGSSDPLDFKGSVGNLSLSQTGFMELLTRIALSQQKLGVRPHEALENLMHIMDASDGKRKLIKASRKSTSVRHFVYGVK